VVQKYIGPHWGGVTPFALTSSNQFLTDSPATVDDSLYEQQARQILHYSARLNDEQKVIAEYWADGPRSELPLGHWCLFAQYVSQRDNHGLDADVKMFFALTNAIFDASIAAWGAKRVYDSVRPVTAIHYLSADKYVRAWAGPYQGTQRIKGRDWTPYQAPTVVTPPFPEYLSGHSTFSAAGAEILKRFTGSDRFGATYTQPAKSSRVEPLTTPASDLTLSWQTFTHARKRGRHLAALRRHPLRAGRPRWPSDGSQGRRAGLGPCPELHQRWDTGSQRRRSRRPERRAVDAGPDENARSRCGGLNRSRGGP